MNELTRPADTMRRLARRTPVLLLLAVVAGGAAYGVRTAMSESFESVAKIAFVEDTRFDYVEAERDRLVGLVDEQVLALLRDDEIDDITFDRPNRETFLDVVVRADDGARARDVAAELADRIVAEDRAVRSESFTNELDARLLQLADIAAELVEQQDEIAEEGEREAFAEANRFEGDTEQVEELTIVLREAQDRLFLATRYRNALLEQQIDVEERIAELEVALAATEAETRVVRPALVPTSPVGPTPATLGFIVAVAVFALGAVASVLVDHERSS